MRNLSTPFSFSCLSFEFSQSVKRESFEQICTSRETPVLVITKNIQCNTRCIECVTHNNRVFAKEREGLAVLPELKLALAEYGNKGRKRLKPENQLGLNAKQ